MDKDIIQKIKDDPEEGARLLVECYGQRLYATAYRLSLNYADAEDLVFQTLAQAVRKIASFGGKSSFFTWLCAILTNYWRMLTRKSALGLFADPPEIEDDHANPGESLSAADDAANIRAEVERLPTRHRALVVLHYFDGLKVPEISRIMGMPEGTVYFLLHEARLMLRKKLASRFGHDGASKETKRKK